MQTRRDFYRSRQWRRLVLTLQMERAAGNGLLYCAHCGKPIVAKYDCVAHHVEELTDANVSDAAVSLNPDNIVLVHHRCHNRIHERFGRSAVSYLADRRVYLVYGSPCSGKSTWVRENAGRNDLVVDMDGIYEAVGTQGRYEKSGAIKQNVFAVRDLLIDQIRTRCGKWQNAYIVGGYPLLMDRVRLMDSAGAECIFIDTPRHICQDRARACRPAAWLDYIDAWWRDFQPDPPPGCEENEAGADCEKGSALAQNEKF